MKTEKPMITIEAEVEVKNNKAQITGVILSCQGLSPFETIGLLEAAKIQMINSLIKKETVMWKT